MTDLTPRIANAVAYVAARCDGAFARDGEGFDGMDTKAGKRLARIPAEDWTPAAVALGSFLVIKYVGQHGDEGLVEDVKAAGHTGENNEVVLAGRAFARQAVKAVDARESFSAVREGDTVTFSFKYDADLVAAVRDLPGRRWNSNTKTWTAPATEEALALAADYGFDLGAPVAPQPEKPAKRIEVEGANAAIYFPYDPALVAAVKAEVNGRRWDGQARRWTAPVTPSLAAFAAAHGFAVLGGTLPEAEVAEEREDMTARSSALAPESDVAADFGKDGLSLFPHQQAGVEFILKTRRTLVGDEMGAGKTATAIASVAIDKALPAIIVCPASLRGNWAREFAMWTDLSVFVATGRKPSAAQVAEATAADVVVINYDILKGWVDALPTPRALVVDESHYVKNEKAQRTKAVIALAERVPADGLVVLMTGTPIVNRPVELASQLLALGRMADTGFSKPFAWKKYYCAGVHNGYGWDFTGAAHLDRLHASMRSNFYLRRTKEEVLKHLPEKMPAALVGLALNGALSEYRKAERNIIAWAREQGGAEAAWKAARAEVLVQMNALRLLAGKAKTAAAVEWVENYMDSNPGKGLVVFAWHKDVQEGLVAALREKGLSVATILGGQRDVEEQKEAFQSGQADVIVCSIQAAREGHTLTRANDVLFVEQGWNPGTHAQAEARVHRIGQTADVQPYYLLADETIDWTLRSVIDRKARITGAVNDGEGFTEDDEASVTEEVWTRLAG